MRSTIDEIEFFIRRARRFRESIFCYVERIGVAAGNHQKRLVDEVHIGRCVKREEVEVAAQRIHERGIRVTVRLAVIDIAVGIFLSVSSESSCDSMPTERAISPPAASFARSMEESARRWSVVSLALFKKPSRRTMPELNKASNSLGAFIRLGGLERIAATVADAEDTHVVGVNPWERRQNIEHAVDIFHAERRIVKVARLAARSALERGVRSNGDVAGFCEFLRLKACYLLFDAAVRVCHDDGLIFFCRLSGRSRPACRYSRQSDYH